MAAFSFLRFARTGGSERCGDLAECARADLWSEYLRVALKRFLNFVLGNNTRQYDHLLQCLQKDY